MPSIFKRRLSFILSVALVCLLPSPAPARLGDRLEEMKQTDFFKFFNLVETGRGRINGKPHLHVTFKPARGNFRELVNVNVKLDEQDRILLMQLEIKRSFVDDPQAGIFARDITKSLLRAAIPAADEKAINDLANEIEFPKELPGYHIARVKPDPQLPAQPTPGYLVYLGKQKSYRRTFSKCRVELDNVAFDGGDELIVSVISKDFK